MIFPESRRVVFRQNPLEEVISQLRFPTTLAIISELPTAFQERIRQRYPIYARADPLAGQPPELSALLARLPLGVQQDAVIHNFGTADGTRTATLTPTSIALTERNYTDWGSFRGELDQIRAALEEIYAPPFYERVGLRYQDVIDRDRLGLAGRSWADLLNSAVVGPLAAEPRIRDAVRQLAANVLLALDEPEGSFIRLQYGVGRTPQAETDVFIIDADLYSEVRHEGGQVDATLGQFNREAGNLFRWTIRPALREALGERDDELRAAGGRAE
jgi:uncharacterized protein (TIGR04255 family)